jgi:hypothetical protein
VQQTERGMWDQNQPVPGVEVGRWVDIVVNNLDDRGHPFHLVRDDYLPFPHIPIHSPLIILLQNIYR